MTWTDLGIFCIGFAFGAVCLWSYFARAGLLRTKEEWEADQERQLRREDESEQ